MSDAESEIAQNRFVGELSDVQRRRLRATCKYIDGLLCDIEHALHSPESESPFPHYVVDVTQAQVGMIEDHIRHLRSQLLRTLDWQRMKPEPPEIPVSRSLITDLGFVEIAVEELKPRHMRGCGAVPEDAIGGLNDVVNELHSLLHSIIQSIRVELGLDQQSHFSESEETDMEK
jgi:hypothetical protein